MTQQHQNCDSCKYIKKAINQQPCFGCFPQDDKCSKFSNWKPVKVTKKKGVTK